MNTLYKYITRAAMALALCVGASSCSQDELEPATGGELPPGDHPLKFTASVEGLKSRADDTEQWVEGDTIAVRIGTYNLTGKYKLNSDGTVMDEILPLNWPRPKAVVNAWYPYVDYDKELSFNIADQSNGYHHIDFMRATTGEERHFKETIDLTFKHQMAKVSTVLECGDGISEEELATARVYYSGFTSVTFSESELTGENVGTIIPDSVNTALLVPRVMNNQPLIIVTITVNVNGHLIDKTLTYTASSNDELRAGYHNRYTVTVEKDRLKVNPPVSASWNDVGEPGPSQPWIFTVVFAENLNIPESRRKDIVFSENVVNREAYKDGTEDHLEVAGNEFSFSCVIPDDDLTLDVRLRNYNTERDTYEYSTETVNNGIKYTFNFRFRSNGMTIAYKETLRKPEVGDFYYDDGTWSSSLKDNKTCIGIVIHTIDCDPSDEQDMKAKLAELNDFYDYDFSKFKDGAVHGYVLAIKDAAAAAAWSSTSQVFGVQKAGTGEDFNGCWNTDHVINLATEYGIQVPAFKACRDFDVPHKYSSGWYLPAHGQMNAVRRNFTIVKAKLDAASADNKEFASGSYWISSERPSALQAWTLKVTTTQATLNYASKTANNKVRAVLTF